MPRFSAASAFDHSMPARTAVLLVQLGTPDAPETSDCVVLGTCVADILVRHAFGELNASIAAVLSNHTRLEPLERVDHLPGDRLRGHPVAGIVGGLPAADLQWRHFHGTAGVLKELDGGKADTRPEKINQAGDEKGDTARRA